MTDNLRTITNYYLYVTLTIVMDLNQKQSITMV